MDERWFEIISLRYQDGRLKFVIDKILQDETLSNFFYTFTGRTLREVINDRP